MNNMVFCMLCDKITDLNNNHNCSQEHLQNLMNFDWHEIVIKYNKSKCLLK